MEEQKNQLPKPEKLLRAPTFGEKYFTSKWYIAALLLMLILLFGGYYFFGGAGIVQEIITPTTPTPSPIVATITPTPNPTKDGWKTYLNSEMDITFNYPSNWEVSINPENSSYLSIGPMNDLPKIYARSFIEDTDGYIEQNYASEDVAFSKKELQNPYHIGSEYFIDYSDNKLGFGPGERTIVTFESQNGRKFLFDSYGIPNENFQRVVSTFKFLNDQSAFLSPTISEEPVFCTMEAKLCPDGSYVGREGPNCEFAECPE